GLQKSVGLAACVAKISGFQPHIAQSKLSNHPPKPIQKEFVARLWIADLPEAFDGLGIICPIQFRIARGDKGYRLRLFSWVLCVRPRNEIAQAASPLEVKGKRA